MEHEFFNYNSTIFNLGSKGDKFYIILSGQVAVFIKDNKEQRKEDLPLLLRKPSRRKNDLKDFHQHEDL